MRTKVFSLMLILAAFVCVTSCSKDDDDVLTPTLNMKNVELYVDETATLTYSPGDCTWSTDNFLVAEVKDGIVTAKHVGTTTIHANDLTCQVTVKPKYTSFTEPFQTWGASKSQIKSAMSGFTLRRETSSALAYDGKGKVTGYVYQFENVGLTTSVFIVPLLNSVDLVDFLLERYWVLDIDEKSSTNYFIYLGTVDLKSYVIYNLNTDGSTVMYISADKLQSLSKPEIKTQLKKQLSRF